MTTDRNQNVSYYTNPAFSQQSEFHNNGVPLSHLNFQKNIRQSPVGAQTPLHYYDGGSPLKNTITHQYGDDNDDDDDDDEEQEFYEEMLVDRAGVIKEKKVFMVSSSHHQDTTSLPPSRCTKSRHEYIPMIEQQGYTSYPVHRNLITPTKDHHRYEANNGDFTKTHHRYEYIPDDTSSPSSRANCRRYEYVAPMTAHGNSYSDESMGNRMATRKLHELLVHNKSPEKSAPKMIMSPLSPRRPLAATATTPQRIDDPFVTPNKPSSLRPNSILRGQYQQPRQKSRQKLNYATKQMTTAEKRYNTAIVAPTMCSPVQSAVYSETTFSRSESWMNMQQNPKKPIQLTLAVAAFMMMLCGGLSSGLCFYMVSIMGRLYFLDFGIIAGFTCLVLGLLGFRTRNCHWLPNRNYISGYIVLSVFSLFTCVGLLVLLVMQPKPGTPLADMTSGAVCGISVLSLILACVGVITSYCCKYPPPDNRVQHSVPGFIV